MGTVFSPKICEDYCSYALKHQKRDLLVYDDCIKMLSEFNKEELEYAKTNLSYLLRNNAENEKLIGYVDLRIEIFNQPTNSKGRKVKLN